VLWLDMPRTVADIYVASDSHPEALYPNNCHGGFDDGRRASRVAYRQLDTSRPAWRIASADYDKRRVAGHREENFSDETNQSLLAMIMAANSPISPDQRGWPGLAFRFWLRRDVARSGQ